MHGPSPDDPHPMAGFPQVGFLRPLVRNPRIEVGEYTYYDDPGDALGFERHAFLYAYGPERLIIGRYCALASGVRFIMPGANHADLGPSTFPFGIFGEPWADLTMDLVMGAPSPGDTVVGNDVWLGYRVEHRRIWSARHGREPTPRCRQSPRAAGARAPRGAPAPARWAATSSSAPSGRSPRARSAL